MSHLYKILGYIIAINISFLFFPSHQQTGKKSSKKKKKKSESSEGDVPKSDAPAVPASQQSPTKPGTTPVATTQKPQSAPAGVKTTNPQATSSPLKGSGSATNVATVGNNKPATPAGNGNKAGVQKTPQILQNKNYQQQQKAAAANAANAQQNNLAQLPIKLPQRYQQPPPQLPQQQRVVNQPNQKTPGLYPNPNNQTFPPQQQQRVATAGGQPQQKPVGQPQQVLQKGTNPNQKNQTTPKNQHPKNQKNNQKTAGPKNAPAGQQKTGEGPTFAQPPPAKKHVPFSKKVGFEQPGSSRESSPISSHKMIIWIWNKEQGSY